MKALLLSLACTLPIALSAQTPTPTPYAPYAFKTLAGLPGGSADGTGPAARFRYPQQLAVDASGNIFVGDAGNYIIRKVTPGGVVMTFAGLAGERASVDGDGTAARFTSPNGLVFDAAGTLFVADGNAIRKITPAGVVSTLVGGDVGTGDAPRLSNAYGIVLDKTTGDLYVTDINDNTVRKVTGAGVMTVLAGTFTPGYQDGQGEAAQFNRPAALYIEPANGFLMVGDTGNGAIRYVTFGGQVGTAFQPGTFGEVYGLLRDANGDLLIADASQNAILKVVQGTGQAVVFAGSGDYSAGSADGAGGTARFDSPRGLAVYGTALYVADARNSTIRKIAPGGVVTTLAGLASAGSTDGIKSAARFRLPYGVTVAKSGDVYVGDSGNATIRKISPAGKVTTVAGQPGAYGEVDGNGSAARFRDPRQLAVDGSGNVYVADRGNSAIRKITPARGVTTLSMNLNAPEGVAFDKAGNLYVADTGNHVILKRTPGGQTTFFAGQFGNRGGNDGDGAGARFNFPGSLAVDVNGFIYVADTANGLIRKISPSGTVTTLPGHWFRTNGVAVDKEGNVFVSDPFGWTISKISPSGEITIIGGVNDTLGSRDGAGKEALFWTPTGLATDSAGRLYVADRANNTIRVGVVPTRAVNISTRMRVGTDPDEMIAGFIVTGNVPKKVIIRALGPSIEIGGQPVSGTLADPRMELRAHGGALIRSNDNWKTNQQQEIAATGIAPTNDVESAIVETLAPGDYTAIVRGKGSSTGIGLVEVYDLETANDAELAQISTRGKVLPEPNVMIGGFILTGTEATSVLVRAIGPEISGVADPLLDPTLKLYNSNGTAIAENDNWRSTQEQAITGTGLPPEDDREAAILKNLVPGNYTAIVAGKGDATGVALVEVYILQ